MMILLMWLDDQQSNNNYTYPFLQYLGSLICKDREIEELCNMLYIE